MSRRAPWEHGPALPSTRTSRASPPRAPPEVALCRLQHGAPGEGPSPRARRVLTAVPGAPGLFLLLFCRQGQPGPIWPRPGEVLRGLCPARPRSCQLHTAQTHFLQLHPDGWKGVQQAPCDSLQATPAQTGAFGEGPATVVNPRHTSTSRPGQAEALSPVCSVDASRTPPDLRQSCGDSGTHTALLSLRGAPSPLHGHVSPLLGIK